MLYFKCPVAKFIKYEGEEEMFMHHAIDRKTNDTQKNRSKYPIHI